MVLNGMSRFPNYLFNPNNSPNHLNNPSSSLSSSSSSSSHSPTPLPETTPTSPDSPDAVPIVFNTTVRSITLLNNPDNPDNPGCAHVDASTADSGVSACESADGPGRTSPAVRVRGVLTRRKHPNPSKHNNRNNPGTDSQGLEQKGQREKGHHAGNNNNDDDDDDEGEEEVEYTADYVVH